MNRARLTKPWVLSVSIVLLLPGPLAQAASHLWRINQMFSNSSGTVQFIELKECCGAPAENFMAGKIVTSNTKSFTIPGNLSGSTANKYLLFATAAFAALPGAPTPDYIIASNFFAINGDTIKYSPSQNFDSFTFGAGALPTNGVNSLQITSYIRPQTFRTDLINSPTNYAGQTGSVNAGCTEAAECDDGNVCTADSCNSGLCDHAPLSGTSCPDEGNPCTDDLCANGACAHLPNNNPCDDGVACTTADYCPGPPSTTCTGTDINTIACPPDCPLDPEGVPYACVNGFCVCAPPPVNDIVWDPSTNPTPWPNNNPRATTRSLMFSVTGPPTPSKADAIRVCMVGLQHPVPSNPPCCPPQDFSEYETATCAAAGEQNGCCRWVGPWATFYETQGPPLARPYIAARLQCAPHYGDWKSKGPISVVGAEIMPSSQYSVQAYAASCMGNEAACTNVSVPVTMYTRRSGDVEQAYNPPATTTQPDAIDVAQMVNNFKAHVGTLSETRSRVQPSLPELNADMNALDIVAVIDALKQFAYPFSGPCPCPSTVTCGVTCGAPCINLNPGNVCMTTCSGGTSDGDPCVKNVHCPGGCCGAGCTPTTVGDGSCRDACGRCNTP